VDRIPFGSHLLRKASISNWLLWLMALCILLMAVFFKMQLDNYNVVVLIAENQQAIIDMQQTIMESPTPANSEPVHFDILPY
jgi:hypothetical protein